ncbi:GNAT family N-acetyltransferase [Actinokineospora soli]|uniref:GNAT family N-acetyltransferase n=1 Tax=Actinokineospora soli TaxID=1048753 RepID=A0ABW2TU03_9PSEU
MTVRLLGIDYLPACTALAADRDWPPEDRKWRLLFRVGRVHAIDAPDGDGLAAVVVATPYEDAVAISMMLVARRYERQGYGKAVLLDALRGARTAVLSATSLGKPLYEHLGFRSVGLISTYFGVLAPTAPTGRTRAFEPSDAEFVSTLDEKAFGARRTALLASLPGFGDLRVAAHGFGGAWDNDGTRVLGPVVASDRSAARDLLHDLAAPGERSASTPTTGTPGCATGPPGAASTTGSPATSWSWAPTCRATRRCW